MQKPKIGVIGLKGLPAYGGAAAVGENIIENLKQEYDFTVYSTSSHTDLKTGEVNGFKQIVFKRLPLKKLNTLYYYIISALHVVFFAKYDLIHLHHRDAAFIILFIKLKYKVILTTHGSFKVRDKWIKYKKYFDLQERFFVKKANKIVCVSKSEARQYRKFLSNEILHIPNGINIINISNCDDIKTDQGYIFFGAGRIIRTKGCEVLLKALKQIKYSNKLLIAGDINHTTDYKNEIMHLSKHLDVVFLGLIKDKDKLLKCIRKARYFIFPSNYEAMSMMLLEAASVQTPIICSDIEANKDIFTDEEVLFFKTDDHIDLSEKIKWAENNLIEMRFKANKAYSKLKRDYLWADIAKEYSQEYEKLLTGI